MIDEWDWFYRKFCVFKCLDKMIVILIDGIVIVVKLKFLGKKLGKSSMMG